MSMSVRQRTRWSLTYTAAREQLHRFLRRLTKKVIGVEIVEEAVAAAAENAERNGLDNCEFIADDVLKALDHITDRPVLYHVRPAA